VPPFCRSYQVLDHESAAGPECLEGRVESGDPQGQDIEKTRLLPAHARPLETTVNDMLARPFNRTGTHGQPTVPRLLVPDASPVALDVADQPGQGIAEDLVPHPHALEGSHDLADAVGEERPEFLVHPGLGPRRVVGVLEVGEGIGVLAQMIRVQRLTHPWNVGLRHGPNPQGPIAQNLPEGKALPARLADDLVDADGQVLCRAQDTDLAAREDRAEGRLLGLGFEPTHQDGAYLGFLPAPVDVGHDPIHGDLQPQVCCRIARRQRVHGPCGLLPLALDLPPLEVLGGAVDEALGSTRTQGHPRAALKEIVGHAMRPFGNHRGVERTYVVGEVPHLRDAQVVIIRPERGPTPTTLKGSHRDAHLAKQGLRTDRPGVDVSYAGILATGCDIRALELLRFPSDLGLEHLPGYRSHLLKDGHGSRRDAVEVRRLQDVLDKTFAPSEELLYDEVMVHGVPPDEKV
jgi:hypothetical protein